MTKYAVTLIERVKYVMEVDAENETVAAEFAEALWCQSIDPDNEYCGEGQGVQVSFVHPVAK